MQDWWQWAALSGAAVGLRVLDVAVLRPASLRAAALISAGWLGAGVGFAGVVWASRGPAPARHGAKAIVTGRFVGVVRALGPFTAGASGMRAGRFVAADVVGAGLWAIAFTGLGYLFAGHVGALLDALHQAQLVLGALLAAGLVMLVVVRRRRRVRA